MFLLGSLTSSLICDCHNLPLLCSHNFQQVLLTRCKSFPPSPPLWTLPSLSPLVFFPLLCLLSAYLPYCVGYSLFLLLLLLNLQTNTLHLVRALV